MKISVAGKVTEYKDISDPVFEDILRITGPNNMWTSFHSIEPLYTMYQNIRYIVEHQIPGAIVECGVWKGGMMQLAALTLQHLGDETRELYLFDTFDGLPEPGEKDVDWDGNSAHATWVKRNQAGEKWGYGGTVTQVRTVMESTNYPVAKLRYAEGMVEDTIPDQAPEQIAVLRLDTDFYSSTLHELTHLYPVLSIGGVLIVDDYGYYRGAREATDEYFQKNKAKMLLTRVNMSVHQGVKIEHCD